MEDYRLEQSGQEVQDILNGAAMQVDLNSEVERATEAENILDGKIDAEEERAKAAEKANADDIDAIEEKIPSGASSSNKLATASDVNEEAQARSDADQTINGKIDAIDAKIPSGASSSNKLATEQYVDDSVATNTATFRGTYNLVSDLGLLPSATHDQIAYALGGEIAASDNNDYCFVQIPTSSETPTQITKIERYKFNGDAWAFEYDLNNSGFTAAQWSAINSGITSGDVTKLAALPTSAELTTLLNGKQDTLTFDNTPTENSNNPVKSGGVYSGIKAEEERAKAAEKANADDIDAIEEKIPSGASSSNKMATASDISGLDAAIEAILLLIPSAATSLNQLADKAFVNSSIATNTATFRGTFNSVSDLHLSISATHEQIGTMLASSIATADNNDYAFVQIPTSAHRPTEIARTERYKFNGTTWEYEYDLNNSGYTTAQWAAINSTITQELVTKLSALPNNDDLTTALSVLTDSISAINAKIPSAASSENKLVDTTAMQTYIAQLLDVLDATYNVTSTDGHVTVQITQTNGKVTAFAVTTSDIASAADLELIAGRVTTAEGNISTNAEDIAQLQAAYAALTQNDLVIIQPTDTWPVANPAENIIYRVVDRVNTPPEYYSDYMWNGTTMVLMAQYSNAIDPRPKKGSTNLVESGGVFDNMGALDVSELNATENPHTLATYADLSAAIAAIPSDYQKGGMSIKFVSSVDNNYIQFRYMGTSTAVATFTNVANWQGVDDFKLFIYDWKLNTYFNSTGQCLAINSASLFATTQIEFLNTNEETLLSDIYIASDLAYIHFVDENGDIISGSSIAGSTSYLTTLQKPQGAKKALITNSFAYVKNPYINKENGEQLLGGIAKYDIYNNTKKIKSLNDSVTIVQNDLKEFENDLKEFEVQVVGVNLTPNSWVDDTYYDINGTVKSYSGDSLFKTAEINLTKGGEYDIYLNVIYPSSAVYCLFTDANNNILSRYGENGYNLIGKVRKPANATKLLVTNSFLYCEEPYIGNNDSIENNVKKLESTIYTKDYTPKETDWVNNSYYDSNGNVQTYTGESLYKTAEIELPKGRDTLNLNVIIPSMVAKCLFIDAEDNILEVVEDSGYKPIGVIAKPENAVKLLVTNGFYYNPQPSVIGNLEAIDYQVNKLREDINVIQDRVANTKPPYCLNLNFENGDYDENILSGGNVSVVSGVGAQVTNGFANRIKINKYLSADECIYRALIQLTGNKDGVVVLSSEEKNSGSHSSIVAFDFNARKIKIYPKNNGSSMPSNVLTELELTNISGDLFYIEIGRKDRQLYAAVTNYATAVRNEKIIDEETLDDYEFPAGWMHDYLCFAQISGDPCIFKRVVGILPKANVVLLGDSITEGFGVKYEESWAYLISQQVEKVLNMGSSGDSVDTCQSIVDTILGELLPKYVIVTIGTNGGCTLTNMQTLRNSIMALGAVPIFNYIYRCDSRSSYVSSTNAIVAQLGCDGARFDYATSLYNDLSEVQDSSLYQSDGVHLNTLGHSAVANRLLKDLPYLL